MGVYLFFGFMQGGLCKGRAYSRGTSKYFLVIGHILFEIDIPVSYFLMLQIQPMGCLLKDIRFYFD